MEPFNFALEERPHQANTANVITELGVGNFKAFGQRQRVPIKPLTLIFGANSSGKSSILHALLLAHHGLETRDFDVHQPSLSGDMADLGGFRSYVHKHESSRTVNLRIETDVDREALTEHLDGYKEEKEPFLTLSRFGLCLTLAGAEVLAGMLEEDWQKEILGMRRLPVAVAAVTILVDGQELLRLAPLVPGHAWFRAGSPSGSAAFLDQLLTSMVARVSVRQGLGASAEAPEHHPLPWPEGTPAQALKETPAAHQAEPARNVPSVGSALARLKEAFAEAITEDTFSFEQLVLRDFGYGHSATRPSAKWAIERGGSDGLLEFYRAYISAWGDSSRPWWAEAQAVRHNLSNLIEFCTARIAETMRGISYLGPLRCVPPRHATAHATQDPRTISGGGLAWESACRAPGGLESVNRWLGPDGLGASCRLKRRLLLDAERVRLASKLGDEAIQKLSETAELAELLFEDILTGTILSHRDTGFGIGQVLPILCNASSLSGKLIAIEQPELHLHPAQQAALGDVFIESAFGKRKNTFLLETHSEHLILRILRRVRETTEKTLPGGKPRVLPEDVSVVFVEPTSKGSIIHQMPVTPDGDFSEPWPGGFFAERLKDLP